MSSGLPSARDVQRDMRRGTGPRTALLLTAYDRPEYLARVLDSWRAVDGLRSWHLRVALEPSPVLERTRGLIDAFVAESGLVDVAVVVNKQRLGVARNPYEHLAALFAAGYDFVVRTEDDLVVADDVLRLFDHAAVAFAPDPAVAAVCASSDEREAAGDRVLRRRTTFTPWVWGTWRDRWDDLIGPTWDHDYSTYNGSPGFESGWDWNLNTRVLPAHGLTTVAPSASRVLNIGVIGQHGTAENLPAAPTFRPTFPAGPYPPLEPGSPAPNPPGRGRMPSRRP